MVTGAELIRGQSLETRDPTQRVINRVTGRRGGGSSRSRGRGGGSGGGQTGISQEEALRRDAEERVRQEQERVQREEAERILQQNQSRIQSQRLSGQLKQNTVEAPTGELTPVKEPFSIRKVGRALNPRNVLRGLFTGEGGSFEDVRTEFNKVGVTDYSLTNRELFITGGGTKVADDFRPKLTPQQRRAVEDITQGVDYRVAGEFEEAAIKRQAQFSQEKAQKEFDAVAQKQFKLQQERVNRGEVGVEQAQKEFDAFGKDLSGSISREANIEFEGEASKIQRSREITRQREKGKGSSGLGDVFATVPALIGAPSELGKTSESAGRLLYQSTDKNRKLISFGFDNRIASFGGGIALAGLSAVANPVFGEVTYLTRGGINKVALEELSKKEFRGFIVKKGKRTAQFNIERSFGDDFQRVSGRIVQRKGGISELKDIKITTEIRDFATRKPIGQVKFTSGISKSVKAKDVTGGLVFIQDNGKLSKVIVPQQGVSGSASVSVVSGEDIFIGTSVFKEKPFGGKIITSRIPKKNKVKVGDDLIRFENKLTGEDIVIPLSPKNVRGRFIFLNKRPSKTFRFDTIESSNLNDFVNFNQAVGGTTTTQVIKAEQQELFGDALNVIQNKGDEVLISKGTGGITKVSQAPLRSTSNIINNNQLTVQRTSTRLRPVQLLNVPLVERQKQKPRVRQTGGFSFGSFNNVGNDFAFAPALAQPQLTIPRSSGALRGLQNTITINPPAFNPSLRIPTGGSGFGFVLPNLPFTEGRRKTNKKKSKRQGFKFQASLTSLALNLRGGKRPRIINGGFTPFELRKIGAR